MSDSRQDGILARIRKILKRTEEAGCTTAEAESAFAKASTLMAEHNLTMEQVTVSNSGQSESWVQEEVESVAKWSLEDNLCYGILKEFYFVEAVLENDGSGRKTFCVFGKPENVEVARYVWGALHRAFDHHWMVYRIVKKASPGDRRLFVSGMARGFSTKLRDEREAQKIERDLVQGRNGSTALALASISDKLAVAFKHNSGNLKTNKSRFADVNGNHSALEAGMEVGKKLNLNKQVEAGRRKAIG